MDRDKLKDLISQSKYCEFESFLENPGGYRGELGIRVKVKEPNKILPSNFFFDISLFSAPTHDRNNDNENCAYTGHWIWLLPDGFGDAIKILNAFAGIFKYAPQNWTQNNMISIKAVNQYEESLIDLLDRWGKKFTESYYKSVFFQGKETEIPAQYKGKEALIVYSKEGEQLGYNILDISNEKIILRYEEGGPKIEYIIPEDSKYIGKRIGRCQVRSSSSTEHRIKELLGNGIEYMNRVSDIKVSVIGCGGIGANVIDFLIRKGVKNIKVFDDDVINKINFQRLPLRARDYNGKPKVDMFDSIEDINYDPKHFRITKENVSSLSDEDIVIMASDSVEAREIVSSYVTSEHIPYINCGVGFRNDNSFATMSYYGAPGVTSNITNGKVNKEDEYNKTINLQLCEYVVMVAAKAADIISRVCGLYADDKLDARKGWSDHE